MAVSATFVGGPMNGTKKFVVPELRILFMARPEVHISFDDCAKHPLKGDFRHETYELDLLTTTFAVYYHNSIPLHRRQSQVHNLGVNCDPLVHYFVIKEVEFSMELEVWKTSSSDAYAAMLDFLHFTTTRIYSKKK